MPHFHILANKFSIMKSPKPYIDDPNDIWETSKPYSANKTPGTWHWPEN